MPDYPSRCQHLKINGTQCGSPALRRNRFCFFHKRFQDERIRVGADRARRGVATFVLPLLEDANSIQIALMQVMRLLLAQQIDHKTASLLLSALRTAGTNLRRADFKPFAHDVVLDVRAVADTPLGSHLWVDEDFEEEEDEVETAADRAIAALETTRKEKEEKEKWLRWAEMQYPDPRKANPSAAITPTGSAIVTPEVTAQATPEVTPEVAPEVTPASSPKKPPNKEEIRQQIREQIRKEFFPGYPTPRDPKSTG